MRAFRQGRPGIFRGFFTVIPGGYFFKVFSEARPALLEPVLDDAYYQVGESLCELGPERLQRREPEGKHAK